MAGREIAAVLAQMHEQRTYGGLGLRGSGIVDAPGECLRSDPVLPVRASAIRPPGERGSEVAAARHGRKVVKISEQILARQCLKYAKTEDRRAYAAAGEGEALERVVFTKFHIRIRPSFLDILKLEAFDRLKTI